MLVAVSVSASRAGAAGKQDLQTFIDIEIPSQTPLFQLITRKC